jgi:hypothetical protein
MMRSVIHDETIYLALLRRGYKEHEIPPYFVRPAEPPVWSFPSRATAEKGAPKKPSAQEPSNAERQPPPKQSYEALTTLSQVYGAQRAEPLSVGPAPGAPPYSVYPAPRDPMSEMLNELNCEMTRQRVEQMKDSTEFYRRLQEFQKPPSPMEQWYKMYTERLQQENIMRDFLLYQMISENLDRQRKMQWENDFIEGLKMVIETSFEYIKPRRQPSEGTLKDKIAEINEIVSRFSRSRSNTSGFQSRRRLF